MTELITSGSGLPRVSFSHDGTAMVDETSYRQLFRGKIQYADKKVILMGRDIKDTLVSAYFQATKRINVFEGTISEFIRTDRFGVLKILTFYDIWLQHKHEPQSFLPIRYEDFHQHPQRTLRKILNFIGEKTIDEDSVNYSIKYCSFDNLKKLEIQNRFDDDRLKPGNSEDPESFKVRKGIINGYMEYLSEEDVAYIDKAIAEFGFAFEKFYAA